MSFVPRLSAPSKTDPNWIHEDYGGKNLCVVINGSTGSVLPNCVGYAWGRFMELIGEKPKLSRENAGKWFGYRSDGYERGTQPRLGAVICWSHYINGVEQAGHVAVVEKINSNGTIQFSNSGYKENAIYDPNSTAHWWLSKEFKAPNYIDWKGYTFQGFIYCPAVVSLSDPFSRFMQSFADQIGLHSIGASSSELIHYFAKQINVPDSLLPTDPIVTTFAKNCFDVVNVKGDWKKGPFFGENFKPRSGDIVFFRYSQLGPGMIGNSKYYAASDCGVVWTCKQSTVYAIQVNNSTGEVVLTKYRQDSRVILGYYRVTWEMIGSDPDSFWASKEATDTVYGETFSREDMSLRQVASLDYLSEPSIISLPNTAKLSVINYTAGLAEMLNTWNSQFVSTSFVPNLSNVQAQPREIIQILMNNGYTLQAAVGICANIRAESNYRTGAEGDYQNGVPTSFGICQWHLGRGQAMKDHCGVNWAANLSGQVEYLMKELSGKYKFVYDPMMKEPRTEQGARNCADIFVRKFEVPANVGTESEKRQKFASELWNQVIISYTPQRYVDGRSVM